VIARTLTTFSTERYSEEMSPSVTSQDRVLVLSLHDRSDLRTWAQGCLLVGLGADDEVREARREFADLDNVMFVVGGRSEIPWQSHFFSVMVDAHGGEPTAEMLRCLAEDGRIVTGR
jgi:hypothetical protein